MMFNLYKSRTYLSILLVCFVDDLSKHPYVFTILLKTFKCHECPCLLDKNRPYFQNPCVIIESFQ